MILWMLLQGASLTVQDKNSKDWGVLFEYGHNGSSRRYQIEDRLLQGHMAHMMWVIRNPLSWTSTLKPLFWNLIKEYSNDDFCKDYNRWVREKCYESWRDSLGHSCEDYRYFNLCTPTGKTFTIWNDYKWSFNQVKRVRDGNIFQNGISTAMDGQQECR